MDRVGAFLVIEKGDPYEKGCILPLRRDTVLIGRPWNTGSPDIAFNSLFISRRHALIKFENNSFSVADLMSKHGTLVNSSPIGNSEPCHLRHGDRITLADGAVIITFNNPSELDGAETVDFATAFPARTQPALAGLHINLDRREVLVDGKQVNITGKDLELLLLLYQKRNTAVSYSEIKTTVWSERTLHPSEVPDVGNDEITALVYRLRKRLGTYDRLITSIPRFGYMLDI